MTFLPVPDRSAAEDDSLTLVYFVYTKDKGAASHATVNYRYYLDSALAVEGVSVTDALGSLQVKVPCRNDDRRRELYLESGQGPVVRAAFRVQDPRSGAAMKCSINPAADSLVVAVGPLPRGRRYTTCVLHGGDTLYVSDFQLIKDRARFTLPLDSLLAAGGTMRVVLSDSAGTRITSGTVLRPWPAPALMISPDSAVYRPRSPVKIKLQCFYPPGVAATGRLLVSVSAARKCLPAGPAIMECLDGPQELTVPPVPGVDSQHLAGSVIREGRARHRSIPLLLMGGETYLQTTTDSMGRFRLPLPNLVTGATDKLLLSVTGSYADDCTLQLKEPDKEIHARLASLFFPSQFQLTGGALDSASSPEEKKMMQQTLQAVVVKAVTEPGQDNERVGRHRHHWDHLVNYGFGVGYCAICGLCRKEIRGGFQYWELWSGKPVYAVSDKDILSPHSRLLQPYLPPQAMPVTDYRGYPSGELHATVYFNPFVSLDERGQAELSFYLSDLKGKLRIEIDGMAAGLPVHGEAEITVRE